MDYRELNKFIKKLAHLLPNVESEIQRAAGLKIYAFLDMENGFWHIRLHESDCEKSAFVTLFGVYQ